MALLAVLLGAGAGIGRHVVFGLPVSGLFSALRGRTSGSHAHNSPVTGPSDFQFGYDQETGQAEFSSQRILSLNLGHVPTGALARYLSDADRIVQAAWPRKPGSAVRSVGPGRFVLPLPSVNLLTMRWKPEVYLRVLFDEKSRALDIQSDGVNLGLSDWWADGGFKDAFEMQLSGHMVDTSEGEQGQLSVDFRMDIGGRLPGPLKGLVPEGALRSAADKVCRVTLGFVLERLADRIAEDYRKWEAESFAQRPPEAVAAKA